MPPRLLMAIGIGQLCHWERPIDDRTDVRVLDGGDHVQLVLAPFVYVQLVYMTASSWIVFSQPPSVWILAGAPIIMGSGFYIWWRERQLTEQA